MLPLSERNRYRQYICFFVFICDLKSCVDERKSRVIIFEVMKKSKIFDRLDLSDDFWEQFGIQNRKLKKQVGLFEIENINKPNVITIALNSKEYYERFDDHSDNKIQRIKKVCSRYGFWFALRKISQFK